MTFTEPLDSTTITSSNIQLWQAGGSQVPATVAPAEGNQEVQITPNAPLQYGTSYYFVVNDVRDSYGNQMTAKYLSDGSEGSNGSPFTTVSQGAVVLSVTGIAATQSYAEAGGGFDNGWQWTFNVTVPSSQTKLQMEFSDFIGSGTSTVPAANDVEYYSPQSDHDSGNPAVITDANAFGPVINLTGDADPNTPGTQVQIVVKVAVPTGTPGGSYSASYGIQTNP